MAEFSNYLENKILDHVLKNISYTSPTTAYVGLFTSDPTDAGTGTESRRVVLRRRPVAAVPRGGFAGEALPVKSVFSPFRL